MVFKLHYIRIDTPGVIQRVSRLFHGHPSLIAGFNTFLPVGYRIDVSVDPHDPNAITVTTPLGTTTQSTSIPTAPSPPGVSRTTRDVPGLPPHATQQPHSSHGPTYPDSSVPLSPNAVGVETGSHSMTPLAYLVGHGHPPPHIEPMYSPSIPGQMTAAEHLNNLNSNRNKTVQVEKQPPEEFNHAIQYLNKIKARYADDPNTYKQFLDILQTYHKEQRHSHDVS